MTTIFRTQISQDGSTDLVADLFSVAAIAMTSVIGLLTIAATI